MSLPAESTTNAAEWTVSELAGALRRTLEERFGLVRVRGEVFGYRGPHASGHAYFCLKDRDARIDAVVWRTTHARLRFKPQEGLEVVVTGRITTFPGKSTYQIVVEQLEPAGIGALMALLDERRRRLAAEGLFAAERKRALPFLPRVIGVVTSPTGAVIRDILHRLADRFPRRVLVWPVRVQGETSGQEVAAAIAGLNALLPGGPMPRPDVIIVARGGGSLEDLWGFNDESVVRAAAASAVPLVAAVGHETDWTLIDHAADVRAPTPSAAAELAVPVRAELLSRLAGVGRRLEEGGRRAADERRAALRSAVRALPSPDSLLAHRAQRVDLAAARLGPALLVNAREHELALTAAERRLARHAPRAALAALRGRLGAIRTKPGEVLGRHLRDRAERVAALATRLEAGRDAALRAERLRLARCGERVGEMSGRSGRAMAARLAAQGAKVAASGQLLASLGYRSVLERGYVLVRDLGGRAVARAAEVGPGKPLELEFADGRRRVAADGGRFEPTRPSRRPPPLAQDTLFDM